MNKQNTTSFKSPERENKNKNKNKIIGKDFIKDSFDLMRSRGPDHESYLNIDEICTLGHQRLSIIDIDNEANQPMVFGEFTIVFNGEIYNYLELKEELSLLGLEFKTTSDTEVLLKGYINSGTSFLNKLNGMFAFAIYNSLTNEIILVRDRFGVKPLHYTIENDVLYFSSEIKPLLKIKENIKKNLSIYDNYFDHMATDYDADTFIEGIFQLEKGSYLEIKNNTIHKTKWYKGNDFSFDQTIFSSKEKTIEFVENTLVDAIDKRMRADVPICLTLSGGIDSTTIYTLIKERLKKDVKTFTFIHPGSPTNEYSKVNKLCESYNDKVITVESSNTNNFEDIKSDLDIVEFPIWGISTRAYVDMYNSIKESGFKVVLEGHGSDEQLGGYPYMIESAFYDYLRNGNFFKAYEILKIEQATGHSGLGNKHNKMLKKFIKSIGKFLIRNNKIKYFQENIDWTVEFKILPIVLRAFDRLSMNSSLESRAPFMDYRVVELFKKLPIEYKLNSIGNKAVLREILKKYDKKFIYEDKEKLGFSSDLPKFFNNEDNKITAKKYIEKFNMDKFYQQKDKALTEISKDVIEWSSIFEMSKVILISMINEKYGLENE